MYRGVVKCRGVFSLFFFASLYPAYGASLPMMFRWFFFWVVTEEREKVGGGDVGD